jgi:hypothetical protein
MKKYGSRYLLQSAGGRKSSSIMGHITESTSGAGYPWKPKCNSNGNGDLFRPAVKIDQTRHTCETVKSRRDFRPHSGRISACKYCSDLAPSHQQLNSETTERRSRPHPDESRPLLLSTGIVWKNNNLAYLSNGANVKNPTNYQR